MFSRVQKECTGNQWVNMIDLFHESEESNFADYGDDTTPYSCATQIPTVISELQESQQRFLIGLSIII